MKQKPNNPNMKFHQELKDTFKNNLQKKIRGHLPKRKEKSVKIFSLRQELKDRNYLRGLN